MKGRPEVCVARSTSVIFFPLHSGTLIPGGRYFASGSFNETSPRCTASASRSAVKIFVTEPISKTVSPFNGRGSPWFT